MGSAPNRILVVQWQNVPLFSGGGSVTAQVQIAEGSNDILLLYANPSSQSGSSATVGIQSDETVGLQYICNQASGLHSNLAIRFRHDSSCSKTYDVYLDTVNPPAILKCNDISATNCSVGSLIPGTTYYWRVRTSNCCGSTSEEPVWSFTVCNPPPAPINPVANPSTICVGQCSTLTATVGAGETVDWFTGSCGGTVISGGASPNVCPTSTTTYYARTRTTSTGCVSGTCASVTVTVNPLPATPTNCQATPSVICTGQCSTLSAVVAAGEIVDWYAGSCGAIPVPGGASPVVCPTNSTTYYARARNLTTGCSSTCCSVIVEVSALPTTPANPIPSDGATEVNLDQILAWQLGQGPGSCSGTGTPVTIHFGEVPSGTPVNGTVIGPAHFSFSSADATIGTVGPGNTTYNHPPNMEGGITGTLTVNFSVPVYSVGYGFALSSGAAQLSATTMTIYDSAMNAIGSSSGDAALHGFAFVEGTNFASSSQGIARAVITFTHINAVRFVLDDLAIVPCISFMTEWGSFSPRSCNCTRNWGSPSRLPAIPCTRPVWKMFSI